MTQRFLDVGRTIYDFGRDFLVRCPRCQQCARVMRCAPSQPSYAYRSDKLIEPRRCVCPRCAYVEEWQKDEPSVGTVMDRYLSPSCRSAGRHRQITTGDAVDWYFHLPLWLQTPCCGHVLWAYNAAHLAFLREYGQADLRERAPVPNTNTTLASRLPGWMKRAEPG